MLHRPTITVLGLLLVCGFLFFSGLGIRDLTSSHEARAAQNAQMILDEGHWLVPRLYDQHLELQKPPMYYWLVALIGWLNGGTVNVWAVRLPAAVSACATVVFVYFLGLRAGRPRTGLFAALILATCVHFTWLAQVGRIDMPLTMTITFALGAFHIGRTVDATAWARLRWQILGYVALGIGLLLKGPIALILPGLVAGSASLWERRWCLGTSLWWGLPLSLAISAPWFVWANAETNNQLWEVFFWYHNVERGVGGSATLAAQPWWFYIPRVAVDLLPWCVVVPVAIVAFFRSPEVRKDCAACLGLIWFGVVVVFLSCMSFKRADYLLPAYPGMAIFLGAWLDRLSESAASARFRSALAYAVGSVAAVCLLSWLAYNVWFVERVQPYRAMAAEIRRETPGPVVFFRAESHVLAYHLGHPVATILEWENLEVWARRPGLVYFVMPQACADEWRDVAPSATLEEVLRSTDFPGTQRDRPLVVLRSAAGNR